MRRASASRACPAHPARRWPRRSAPATGAASDRAYLTEQVAAHDLTLALFRHAARNAEDDALRSFAQRHADEVAEHMQRAERLLRATTAGGARQPANVALR